MDATGCAGHAQATSLVVQWCPAATLLPGIPGLVVTGVTEEEDGSRTVHVETQPDLREQARQCHGCGMRGTIKERPVTEPRDVPWGGRMIRLQWRKMRLECENPRCPVGTFTEWLPAVPPRARLTSRERDQIGAGIGDDLVPVTAAARRHGVSERTAQAAFGEYADQQLADLREQPRPVEAAGIDEFRRGTARPASDGKEARSEWFTHLVDLSTGGTLGLAQERTGEAGKSLIKEHEGTLRYLAMDLSAPYRSTAPDSVTVIADAFHLVQLANRKIDAAFRRLSYRTEHSHDNLGLPRPLHYMLRHNIETISPDHLAVIIDTLDGDGDGQQIAAVWIAKEQLRHLLALRAAKTRVTPAPSAVRDRLTAFYLWCADHAHIPELKTLASTIEKWQQPVIDAVLTGYSNAKAEAHNRTAKLVARTARGFANPGNQARRVRMATTRSARLGTRPRKPRRPRKATGPLEPPSP
ncbi:MAG TPA: ISL3 family transposase [Streptosporangiaceae bacterium]